MEYYTEALKWIGSILGSLIAAYLGYVISKIWFELKSKRMFGKFEGTWVERIDSQDGRKFSVAEFKYDQKTRTYKYDGKNFSNDGSEFLNWKTVALVKDKDSPRLLYIYEVDQSKVPPTYKEGFGVTNFCERTSKFIDGYFVDSDRETAPRDLRFIRIEELASNKEVNFYLGNRDIDQLKRFIKHIVKVEKELDKNLF